MHDVFSVNEIDDHYICDLEDVDYDCQAYLPEYNGTPTTIYANNTWIGAPTVTFCSGEHHWSYGFDENQVREEIVINEFEFRVTRKPDNWDYNWSGRSFNTPINRFINGNEAKKFIVEITGVINKG